MGLYSWWDSQMHKMNVWDIAAIKWAAFFAGLMIGAYIKGFVADYFWLIFVIFWLLVLKICLKLFGK